MKMEIPAWSYFLFWATINVVSSRLGFSALDKTDISNSISPSILSLLKHAVAVAAYLSSLYAFLSSPQWSFSFNKYLMLYAVVASTCMYYVGGSLPPWYFFIFIMTNSFNLVFILLEPGPAGSQEFKTGVVPLLAAGSAAVLVGNQSRYFTCVVPSVALYIFICWLFMSRNKAFDTVMTALGKATEFVLNMRRKKKGEWVEFGFAMVGTILFQNFFRLTSLNHVVAFLFFTVAWLANLALVRASDDMGIFNFLVSNVVVGCTVSQFGLQGTTWLVHSASFLLYGLRLTLRSVSYAENEVEGFIRLEF